MKFPITAIVMVGVMGLTGCGDNLGYQVSERYGIPHAVISSSINKCDGVQSAISRLWVEDVDRDIEYSADNTKIVTIEYSISVRCMNAAMFKFTKTTPNTEYMGITDIVPIPDGDEY